MAEEKSGDLKGTIGGWIKAALTSIVGLISGACLMYLTPVINNTIKPAKPVANFAVQVTGLAVNFDNHSTGGVDGWWDFGDGSALEPFSPKQTTVAHTYDKAGTYTVKLSLTNLIGEAQDRTINVNIDGATATNPEISLFEITPITPGERAPAVYRVQTKVKNATLCLLSFGDDRPTQMDGDSPNQERYVTFEEMGPYTIRLSAINGKNIVEKSKTVYVGGNDGRDLTAKLQVNYEAVKVDRLERRPHIPCVWQHDGKESSCAFHCERAVESGYLIQSAEILNKDEKNAPVRKVSLEITPDKKRFSLNGELVRSNSLFGSRTAPFWRAELKIIAEKRSAPVTINRGDVIMAVGVNSAIKIPLQPMEEGWEVLRKLVTLELYDGARKVWESNQPATNAKVTMKNQSCYVSVLPQSDGTMLVKIDSTSSRPTLPMGSAGITSIPPGPPVLPMGPAGITSIPPGPQQGPSALPPLPSVPPLVTPSLPAFPPDLPMVRPAGGVEPLPFFPPGKGK